MSAILTNEEVVNAYLEWLGATTRKRYLQSVQREEEMGKHSRPDDVETDGTGLYVPNRVQTDTLQHTGYQCEACKGYWAALEPVGMDKPEELPCLATKGCEGFVVALYPSNEPPPGWVPVIIQGGKT